MLEHLSGLASVDRGRRDQHGWGCNFDKYRMTKGFKKLYAIPTVPCNPTIRKRLWDNKTLPKIDLFSWTLVHGRILARENLERRGFVGPFQFPLCYESNKTIQHLFFKCLYASIMWKQMVRPWVDVIQFPRNIQQYFINWEKAYNGDQDQKKDLKNAR